MEPQSRKPFALIALLLAATTLVAYAPIWSNGFVDFDDDLYVTNNAYVLHGFSLEGLRWAFTATQTGIWHPLTWMSLMLDGQLFGATAQAVHGVNLALHALNVLLVFGFLVRATSKLAPSALVAFSFACHPTHVESVAWASERKDVLCMLFTLFALHSWLGWVRAGAKSAYAWTALWLVLALLAKPMAVTFPALLLLLDFWPLNRWESAVDAKRAVLEKLPLVAVVASASAVAWFAQRSGGAMTMMGDAPIAWRVTNAITSYVIYVGQFVWPSGLAAFYPHPNGTLGTLAVAGSAALLVALSIGSFAARKRAPFVWVGWAWFVGTLVPVIGLVQVGGQAHADRYTYLPFVGLGLILAWSLERLIEARPSLRTPLRVMTVALVVAWSVLTMMQVRIWRDSETLFRHALAVTSDNWMALNNLGFELQHAGKFDAALPYYEQAVALRPDFRAANTNLGEVDYALGRFEDAEHVYRAWLARSPNDSLAQSELAATRFALGEFADAAELYRKSLAIAPDRMDDYAWLSYSLVLSGRADEAVEAQKRAVALDPTNPNQAAWLAGLQRLAANPGDASPEAGSVRETLTALLLEVANNLVVRSRFQEAQTVLERAVRFSPFSIEAHNLLGTVRLQLGNFDVALAEFRVSLQLDPNRADTHCHLGDAHRLRGEVDAAREEYSKALEIAPAFAAAKAGIELLGKQ